MGDDLPCDFLTRIFYMDDYRRKNAMFTSSGPACRAGVPAPNSWSACRRPRPSAAAAGPGARAAGRNSRASSSFIMVHLGEELDAHAVGVAVIGRDVVADDVADRPPEQLDVLAREKSQALLISA